MVLSIFKVSYSLEGVTLIFLEDSYQFNCQII